MSALPDVSTLKPLDIPVPPKDVRYRIASSHIDEKVFLDLGRECAADIIRALNSKGMTILLVEQNVAVSLKISAQAYVMENGGIRFAGVPAELLASDDLRRAYLGA